MTQVEWRDEVLKKKPEKTKENRAEEAEEIEGKNKVKGKGKEKEKRMGVGKISEKQTLVYNPCHG